MHDDHFLIVEAASSWVDGYDYNNWLPWSPGNTGAPHGHSFTYVGLNYFYFYIMKFLGVSDPKILMLINRIIHALFSLLIVHFSIKITEKISNKKAAVSVGWILALLWILPFLSVRNLVEIVCIPFMLWSVWLTLKSDKKKLFFIAGLLMGMAVSIRYQTGVFAVGMAAVFFFQKKWTEFFLFCGGVLLTFFITQGLVDYLIWGYPFAEFVGYFTYNANEGTEYIPNNNYFMYLLVLIGLFLLPLGVVVGWGFFSSVKKYWGLILPVFLFLLFHSFYPSKQERFIFPVFPFFLIVGVAGFYLLMVKEVFQKWWNISYKIFWAINIPLLMIASIAYSKKSRVEAMYYFYENQEQPKKILIEASGETGASMLPCFYSGYWAFGIHEHNRETALLSVEPGYVYDYIIFFGEDNLTERKQMYRELYPKMELRKICKPSFVDQIFKSLNPLNKNEYIEVWRTNEEAK